VANRYGYGQLKIIAGSCKSYGSTARIIGTEPFANKKAQQKHHGEVNHQWNSYPQHIKRDTHYHITL
jgi:hypothetical protein